MGEAFWVSGGEYSFSPDEISDASRAQKAGEVLKKSLEQGNIKAAWVDEIHWYSNPLIKSLLVDATISRGFPPHIPVFVWERQALLDHFVADALARSILCDDRQLTCLGEVDGRGVSVMCLASHTAVGRYNLAPQACMAGRFSLPANGKLQASEALKVLQSEIEKRDIDAGEVACLAVEGDESVEDGSLGKLFPNAAILSRGTDTWTGAVYRVNALVNSLGKSEGRFGISISSSGRMSILVTLIEKV
jgi:hypothetical protein